MANLIISMQSSSTSRVMKLIGGSVVGALLGAIIGVLLAVIFVQITQWILIAAQLMTGVGDPSVTILCVLLGIPCGASVGAILGGLSAVNSIT